MSLPLPVLHHDYLLAALLGIVEGLTEFLPVSSTAHLRIAEAIAGISLKDPYWTMFSIVIQLGAILSLPIYFRETLWAFLRTFPRGSRGDKNAFTHPLALISIAFLFTAVPALLLGKIIGKNLESVYVMGAALVIGGVVMWVVDAAYSNDERQPTHFVDRVRVGQAIWIGACQTLAAVFPGVSRSMATIAAGQIAGMTRAASLEFSFFLSIPTMIAATSYDLIKTLRGPGLSTTAPTQGIDTHGWVVLLIGGFVSFVVAYVVVAWFMRWVRRHGFVPFAIYRLVIGAAILTFASRLTG